MAKWYQKVSRKLGITGRSQSSSSSALVLSAADQMKINQQETNNQLLLMQQQHMNSMAQSDLAHKQNLELLRIRSEQAKEDRAARSDDLKIQLAAQRSADNKALAGGIISSIMPGLITIVSNRSEGGKQHDQHN